MTRRRLQKFSIPVVAMVAAALILPGCGGGGGGGGGGSSNSLGLLIGVSFIGFATVPSPTGPNAGVPLPRVFRDETIEFRFDGQIDAGILGGFFSPNGTPVEFTGISANPQSGVPYYAYADQNLARASIEIRLNEAGGALLQSYIVGRHKNKLDTIVVDPKVSATNPFGLGFNDGFLSQREYTYRIPPNSLISAGGATAQPVGVSPLLLPVILPPFTPQPTLSLVFLSNNATGPDPIPPAVVSITTLSGSAGTSVDPMDADEVIRVEFSKPVDPSSLDQLENFVVRNTSLPNSPLVPGVPVIAAATPFIVDFVPASTYGPGPYNIQIRVGSFGNQALRAITGFPQGTQGVSLALSNSLERSFVTEACPTCAGTLTVVESFATQAQRDGTFQPTFNYVGWANVTPLGSLCSDPITGSALAPFSQGSIPGLGTRFQRVLNPAGGFPGTIGATPNPAGLFSPFDTNQAGQFLAGVNPAGGSHIMHILEAVDLGNPRASLELVEWGPTAQNVTTTTYPNYYAWCGMTTTTAPITCPAGVNGMSSVYATNYNIVPQQSPDPLNLALPPQNCPFPLTVAPNTNGGVRVNGPIPYTTAVALTTYYPFPVFSPPFDYIGTGTGSGSLLFEQNISPGQQRVNFNRYRAQAVAPVRRVIGAPKTLTTNCNSGNPNGAGGGCETYDMRYTFVNIVSSGRSSFYDTSIVTPQVPTYDDFRLTPAPQAQPASTSALWELEGANAIANPNQPSGATTGFMTYWNGTPANGVENPLVLNNPTQPTALQLTGRRFFRFRVTLRNDPVNNGQQCYANFIMGLRFQ